MKFIFAHDKQFPVLAEKEIAKIPGSTAFYSSLVREYDHLYLGTRWVEDLSFLAYLDSWELAAYVPVYLCRNNGGLEFSYGGDYLSAPIFALPEASNARSRVEEEIFSEVSDLAARKQAERYRVAIEPVELVSGRTLFNFLKMHGFRDESSASRVIDLREDEDTLWRAVRKSYRPLITRAMKKFPVTVIDRENWNYEACEKYRILHHLAAGRVTRPRHTFETMYEMIRADQAFLVAVTNPEGAWAVAALFYRFNGHVYYASSATHPDAGPDGGHGHYGIWAALRHARSREDRFLDMGWQPVPGETGDAKATSIALFKSGFGCRRVAWFRGTKQFNE